MRCVIVDDSEDFLASATRLLESQGMQVIGRASSGEEALTLTEELAPDVVLVDIMLGEEDGIGLARQLAERAPPACVVLISSHDWEELAELVAGSGAAGFIPKHELGAAAITELVG